MRSVAPASPVLVEEIAPQLYKPINYSPIGFDLELLERPLNTLKLGRSGDYGIGALRGVFKGLIEKF